MPSPRLKKPAYSVLLLAVSAALAAWLGQSAAVSSTRQGSPSTAASAHREATGVGPPGRASALPGPVPVRRAADAGLPELAWKPYRRPREVNASVHPASQAESSIAVNGRDPDNLVAATMNLSGGALMVLSSNDGGQTFAKTLIPEAPDTSNHADPWVRFASDGTAYLAFIPVAPPGNAPLGIAVTTSSDGGATWAPAQRISNDSRDDKLVLEVDTHEDSPWHDRVYVAWKWPNGGVFLSIGSAAGFTPPRQISSLIVSGLDMAIGSDGTVYLTAHNRFSVRGDRIVVWRSSDGGETWDPPRSPSSVRADWYTATPSVCRRMALIHPTIAVDDSAGERDGHIYVAWPDYAAASGDATTCSANPCDPASPCESDVFYSYSSDGGATWSRPVTVHEEGLDRVDQFQPWLEVDSDTGHVLVSYRDTRQDQERQLNTVYVSRSTDGVSWEPSFALGARPGLANNGFQYGDYQQHVAAAGKLIGTWADYRGELASAGELFVGRVTFRGRAGAWRVRNDNDNDGTMLAWAGPIRGRKDLDLFLRVWDPATRTTTWVDGAGNPQARPISALFVAGARKTAALEFRLKRDVLRRLRQLVPEGILLAEVFEAGTLPDRAVRVESSRLKLPLR